MLFNHSLSPLLFLYQILEFCMHIRNTELFILLFFFCNYRWHCELVVITQLHSIFPRCSSWAGLPQKTQTEGHKGVNGLSVREASISLTGSTCKRPGQGSPSTTSSRNRMQESRAAREQLLCLEQEASQVAAVTGGLLSSFPTAANTDLASVMLGALKAEQSPAHTSNSNIALI